MATQHTPGPWAIERRGRVAQIVSMAPQIEGGDCTVATVYEMQVDNACLIAAAPELLAALRNLVDVLEANPVLFFGMEDTCIDEWHAGIAAIAKAEGRAPAKVA